MEQTVTRLRFRIQGRGLTVETEGRIVASPEGTHLLQVGLSSPEHAHMLLEVGPVDAEAALWPLFRTLCEYRSYQALDYRRVGARGPGDWEPLPDAASPASTGGPGPAAAGKKSRKA